MSTRPEPPLDQYEKRILRLLQEVNSTVAQSEIKATTALPLD